MTSCKGAASRIVKATYLLWSTYLLLKPFYVFDSGLPQPADFLLAALAIGVFMRGQVVLARRHVSFTLWACLFFVYVSLVNGAWAVILSSPVSLVQTLSFYTFNFVATIVFFTYYQASGRRLLLYTGNAVAASLLMQALLMIPGIAGYSGGRIVAYFNNPNQLGYFALLGMALLVVLACKVRISQPLLLGSFMAGLLLLSISLSKAAMVSAILLVPALWPLLTQNSRRVLAFTLLLSILLTQLQFISPGGHPLVTAVTQRLSSIGVDGDDTLAGRGYDRIVNHPEYLFLGAGEVAIGSRDFDSSIALELHSTLGNILFSYGVIGLWLFLALIAEALRGKRWVEWLPIMSVMAYGLTHNGVRHTWLWILLAVTLVEKGDDGSSRPEGR